MFNQAHVAAQLLRLMITGEHPVDLKLVRVCTERLAAGADARPGCDLRDKIELLDQAQLFKAPPSFLRGLQHDALETLDEAEKGLVPHEDWSA